jgi:hypothetical protein
MIQINLLPDEFKKSRRTPLRLMAAIAAGVTVNVSLAAYAGWVALGPMAEVNNQIEVLEGDAATLVPLVEYHRGLEKEKKLYESRERTLDEITKQRVSWTAKLDQLLDLVNRGGDRDEKYLIWFDNLTVAQIDPALARKGADSGGTLRASAHSGDGDITFAANFLEDLARSDFQSGFRPPAPPSGQASEADPRLMPSVVFSFNLGLELLPLVAPAQKKSSTPSSETAQQAEGS